jgi:hypothetical protein
VKARKVILAVGLTGASILALLKYAALPAVERNLTTAQIQWLRQAFRTHPILILVGMLAIVILLSIPVLLAGLWAARGESQR